jgi:exopolysaccharide biosynthesis WecB/TagA/CpsF family protein
MRRKFGRRPAVESSMGGPGDRLDELDVLGVRVQSAPRHAVLHAVAEAARRTDQPISIAWANAHSVNVACSDSEFRDALNGFTFVFNDGIGIALAARVQGRSLPANLNGSDLSPDLLRLAADEGWSVYLLGARPGVAGRAATRLRADIPQLVVAGTHHGYFDADDGAGVVDDIRASGAEVLLVAIGSPFQEKWLSRNLEATGCRIGVCVGGFLDFASGERPRAPHWMNRVGVEWAYRLAHEPLRLSRRYLVGNPLFIYRILRDAPGRRRRRVPGCVRT